MWQRFTEQARKVVFAAQEEAQRRGDHYVDTEHLLLGLLRGTDTVAVRVITELGVVPAKIQKSLESELPSSGEAHASLDMTLTPRAKRVIDLAYDEARNLNNNYIGTEHLLLGLIREGDGLAGRILAKHSVDLERARRETMKLQDQESKEEPRSPTPPLSLREAARPVALYVSKPGPEQTLCMLTGQGLRPHLLLTLIADEESKASRIVAKQCPNLAEVDTLVRDLIQDASKAGIPAGKPDRLDDLLLMAQSEAGNAPLTAEHLLLALLRETDEPFGEVLNNAGLSLEESRRLASEESA